jgi:hypothetical protein
MDADLGSGLGDVNSLPRFGEVIMEDKIATGSESGISPLAPHNHDI